MKKFANFIVEKRYYILALVLILAILCSFLIPQVIINRDMTKYLPTDSPMKAGLDIMKEEFPETKIGGSIRVMFQDLPKERIPEIVTTLQGIENVTGVDYDETEAYNKDGYTLMNVKTDFAYKSEEELAIEDSISELYRDDNVVYQHTNAYITTIPPFVMAIVAVLLIIILFIMCASYVEPLLFLATIGIAIVMNLGTNIIFGEVAETTFALSAILQLALSMDYSIILMNRYRQEKQKGGTKKECMKTAFVAAFPSIISSGMTTVIGLVMLIFMSFRIGLDLGLVMAKGVALSMLCVLTLLPALILIFDKWIDKTAKKEMHIPTKFLAKFGYKARKVLAVCFVVLFVGSFMLQNITDITFNQLKNDQIEKVFPSPNPVVLVYNNEDSDKIGTLATDLAKKDHVQAVLSYESTIGKPMTPPEMSDFASSMGGVKPDPSLVSVIYYKYFAGDSKVPNMTLEEFIAFVTDDLMENPMFEKYFDEKTKDMLLSVKGFASKDDLLKMRTPEELATALRISREDVNLIYALHLANDSAYQPKNLLLADICRAMNAHLLSNPTFQSSLPADTVKKLSTLTVLSDKTVVTAPVPADQLAAMVEMPVETVSAVYMLAQKEAMSFYEFTDFAVNTILKNPAFAAFVQPEDAAKMTQLHSLLTLVVTDTEISHTQFAEIAGIDSMTAKMLYATHEADTADWKMSLYHTLLTLQSIVKEGMFPDLALDEKAKSELATATILANAVVNAKDFTPRELFVMLHSFTDTLTQSNVELLYLYRAAVYESDPTWTMTVETMLHYVQSSLLHDPMFKPFFSEEIEKSVIGAGSMISMMKANLLGKNHSMMLMITDLPAEGDITTEFVDTLAEELETAVSDDHYLVGNSVMNVEMEHGFSKDLMFITVLTAVAIFLVVAFTFRSVLIPLILVLLVQCGVYITVSVSGLLGNSMYYLALLVVQCILMGATIDYGIVFTNYYIDNRKTKDILPAMIDSFKDAIHTILTSGLIIILITGAIGFSPADPAITQICKTLCIGTLSAVLLILFVLPGLLAVFDRFITKRNRKNKKEIAPAVSTGETVPDISDSEKAPAESEKALAESEKAPAENDNK